MKKIVNLLFALLVLSSASAAKFTLKVADDNIPVSNVENQFGQYLDINSSMSFVLVKTDSSQYGYEHRVYQQYYEGDQVIYKEILVHSRNGKVISMNGDIMLASEAPQATSQRLPRKMISSRCNSKQQVEGDIVIVNTSSTSNEYRYAYQTKDFERGVIIYTDAVTGDVIKEISFVNNLYTDQTISVNTMFNGIQNVDGVYDGMLYYFLFDQGRNIKTLDASIASIDYGEGDGEDLEEIHRSYFQQLLTKSMSIGNPSTTWRSTWDPYIFDFTVEYVKPGGSWSGIGDSQPDLYVKLYDENYKLLYTSSYVNDYNNDYANPAKFSLQSFGLKLGYIIEFWDYDPIGSDDLIDYYVFDNIYDTGYDLLDGIYAKSNNSQVTLYFGILHNGEQPAYDVHWGMEKTYDFYLNTFGRRSYDNEGSIIYNLVNIHNDGILLSSFPYNAAAANIMDLHFMMYGMGGINYKGYSSKPFVSLDVMAHEFTHMVTAMNGRGGLEYYGESGALNEGFSDMMAVSAVNYAKGEKNWMIGSEFMLNIPCLRTLNNPNEDFNPNTYMGKYWNDVENTNDNGGVHANSAVPNLWFYYLTEGGSGRNNDNTPFRVQGIGIEKSQLIAYLTLTAYLVPQSDFNFAREASLLACEEIYGSVSIEYANVINAWNAVGVYGTEKEYHKYSLLINGEKYVGLDSLGTSDYQGRDQFLAEKVSLKSGDILTFFDNSTYNSWAVTTLDPYGAYANFTSTSAGIMCNVSGCYDLYLKLKYADDLVYIGASSDCEALDEISYGRYAVVAKRKSGDNNWYYMTSNLGSSSTKRYQAVSTGATTLDEISTSDLGDEYIWELVATDAWMLKNGTNYSVWSSGNSANLGVSGQALTLSESDGHSTFQFYDGTNVRYLGLNNTAGNNYFAYYTGTAQQVELYLIPISSPAQDDPIERECHSLPFYESFASNQGDFTIENVSLDGLGYVWSFASGYGMKASAYVSSVNHPTESWLISPCLELPEDAAITLTFDHVYRFTSAPTSDLTLLVSEDYVSGAPSTATWTPVAIPTYSSGSNWTFVNAGNINLDAYAGKNVTLAFRYKSSSSAAATWEIKNVSVTSSSITTGVEEVLNQNNATKCIIDGHLFILRDGHKFTATGTMVE